MGLFFAGSSLLQRYFFQHLDADFPGCDFAQSGYSGFVFAFYFRRVPLVEHTGPVGGCEYQLETIGDLLEAVFDSDAGHAIVRKN